MVEILLVEDAKFFRTVLKSQIESNYSYKVSAAENYEKAKELLATGKFDLALLDLNLPDAPNGEIVDLVTEQEIPSIIFSGSFLEEIRDQLEKQYVIDYVVKDSPASLHYVVNTVDRFFQNGSCNVLVVDDSKVSVKLMSNLLAGFNFNVHVAYNGQEALRKYEEIDDIRLIICDYNMPDIQGDEVCKRIRGKKSRDEVCIIGVSAYGNHALSAQFLKAGANDFLVKPFLAEEFMCRVTLNMDALDKVHELDELVHTDLVTQLKNRRFLEKHFKNICDQANGLGRLPVCGIFELDDFRTFNDAHGAEAGDAVLFTIARKLQKSFDETVLIIRYGGSQFCLIATPENVEGFVEDMRQVHKILSTQTYEFEKQSLSVSLTSGVVVGQDGKFQDIISQATGALITAKQNQAGRFFTV